MLNCSVVTFLKALRSGWLNFVINNIVAFLDPTTPFKYFFWWFQFILGSTNRKPSDGYYLIFRSENSQIIVDPVIHINGKITEKIDKKIDYPYNDEKGHVFFKINENFENPEKVDDDLNEIMESKNFEMDWSELCGEKCHVEIQIQIRLGVDQSFN